VAGNVFAHCDTVNVGSNLTRRPEDLIRERKKKKQRRKKKKTLYPQVSSLIL
jgi:hypothetical protein